MRLTEKIVENVYAGNPLESHLIVNKLGQYEDVDESPEHLAKIKKALEIIKEKKVDVWYLMTCIEQKIKPLQFYNEYMEEINGIKLTQEEFDLLKEVLL